MGNLPKNPKRVELEKVINAYRRLIEDDLMKKHTGQKVLKN